MNHQQHRTLLQTIQSIEDQLNYMKQQILIPRRQVLIAECAQHAARLCGVDPSNIYNKEKGRMEESFFPRQVAMYLARRLGYGFRKIGDHFDKKHSTVIHAVESVQDRMDTNPPLKMKIEKLVNELTSEHLHSPDHQQAA